MDEINTNVELEEEKPIMNPDELQKFFEEQLEKMRTQGLLLGSQSMCKVILDKIYVHLAKPGKKSYRDYERLVADIKKFCETGLSRKVNLDGTTSPIEGTKEPEEATE